MANQQLINPTAINIAKLKRDKPEAYQGLMRDVVHLDRLARAPYVSIEGAKTVAEYVTTHQANDGTAHEREVNGRVSGWHEFDASRIRFLAHLYDAGAWDGDRDRRLAPTEAVVTIPLRHTLNAQHLLSMASFIRHHGGPDYLVQGIIDQATRSIDGRDITSLEVAGIAPTYSDVEHRAASDADEPYFFLDAEGAIAVAAALAKRKRALR
jgi:hypothetical protein